MLVVGPAQVGGRRHQLAQVAEPVDRGPGRGGHGPPDAEHPALPRLVEDRLVGLGGDRPEAVHAAHVMDAVHGRSRLAELTRDANHGVAGDQRRELVLAHPLGARRTLRQDQVADLRGAVPDPDLDLAGRARRRTP